MDFPIVILAVVVIGTAKAMMSSRQVSERSESVYTVAVSDYVAAVSEDIAVGNNLELKRELGAFTAIVKEMGLMK